MRKGGKIMDHSIRGYLSRRSVDELKELLRQCQENPKEYGYLEEIVREILRIKREKFESGTEERTLV